MILLISNPGLEASFQKQIRSLGFRVITFSKEDELIKAFQENFPEVGIVIIDVERHDIELCQKLRHLGRTKYTHIILLGSKGQEEKIIEALDAGASDYIFKPVKPIELKVKLLLGKRLVEFDTRLREERERIRTVYEKIKEDIETVGELNLKNVELATHFIPSDFISGDVYNVFRLDENYIGMYQIDISGHGITSGFYSLVLYHRLNPDLHSKPYPILKFPSRYPPYYQIVPPKKVIEFLDNEFNNILAVHEQFFTVLYGILNIKTGKFTFCRAGHNPPLLLSKGRTVYIEEGGGPPVGMGLPRSDGEITVELSPGDEIVVFTDGIAEVFSPDGDLYGRERIKRILEENRSLPLSKRFELLVEDVRRYCDNGNFPDDISIMGFKWIGRGR
jgi:sigma-B regulation protein RsbU (phosphoserine phosphatase)